MLGDHPLALPQTSAHAEMDPGRAESRPDERANLRSRGDGPNPKMPITQDIVKPPLTRRWTPRRRGQRGPHRQTSAHAEMDPSWTVFRPARKTNLRSRGDGPSRDVVSSLDDDKPPLTRRWTPDDHSCDCAREQTSAHAEMDPRAAGSFRLGRPNLRSRGDGPADEFFIRRRDFKPPLTRRWTSSLFLSDDTFCQTSAHAEMDPRWARRSPARWPNLRSRGDGPISVMMYLTWFTKPPLTRRWTPTGCGHVGGDFQTSAHAEMDPCDWARPTRPRSNLRSRGDGPRHTDRPLARERKPPLTRRWTYATRSKLRQNGQTSAHAEMDLRPLRPHSVSVSNLRSRGDGPDTRLAFGHSVSKPPLTRRWTILPCLMLNTFSQTSAHAEMDLLDTTYTDLYRPNLRSRGDGPQVYGVSSM